MPERLRIGLRLLLAPCVLALLLAVCCAGAWHAMVRQNQALEMIVNERAARIREAGELAADAQQAHARMYQLLTWIGASFSAPRIDGLGQDIYQRHAAIERKFVLLARRSHGRGPAQRLLEQAGAAHATYVRAILDVIEFSQVDHSMSANAMSKADLALGVVAARLAELARFEQAVSEHGARRAADDVAALSVLMPLLVALSLGATLGIATLVRRALLRAVAGITGSAAELANGSAAIARASAAQATALQGAAAGGINALSEAIGEIERMTRQNAVLVNQTAAAARKLWGQASSLSQALGCCQLDDSVPDPETAGPPEKGGPHLRLASRRP